MQQYIDEAPFTAENLTLAGSAVSRSGNAVVNRSTSRGGTGSDILTIAAGKVLFADLTAGLNITHKNFFSF